MGANEMKGDWKDYVIEAEAVVRPHPTKAKEEEHAKKM